MSSAAEFTRSVLDAVLLNSDPSDSLAVGDVVTIYIDPAQPDFRIDQGLGPVPNASFTPWWLFAVRGVVLFVVATGVLAGGRRVWGDSVDRHRDLLTLERRGVAPQHAFTVSRLESRSSVRAMVRLYANHIDYERPGILRIRHRTMPYESVTHARLRRSMPPTRRLTLQLRTGDTIHIDGLKRRDAELAREIIEQRRRQ